MSFEANLKNIGPSPWPLNKSDLGELCAFEFGTRRSTDET